MKGTYTLLLLCTKPFSVSIGSLGYASIGRGYYIYTGSGLGQGSASLEGRLGRHLRVSKKARWHVDYLSSDSRCRVKAAVCLRSRRRLECAINKAVVKELSADPVLARAGSSDCKCDGHLTKVGSSIRASKILTSVMSVYKQFGKSVGCMQFVNLVYKSASHRDLVEETRDKSALVGRCAC